MTEKERMIAGLLYSPNLADEGDWEKCSNTLARFNCLSRKDWPKGIKLLAGILGHIEPDAVIVPPFYCEKGSQISIGKHFYANTGLLILDVGKVSIKDDVYIGPRVSIYTACHPIDDRVRNMDLEYTKPVLIESSVWIGGNVTINPGVTIGKGSVIGSGSVVTRDVPAGVVAAGNPCRVIREITQEDHAYWNRRLEEYGRDKKE